MIRRKALSYICLFLSLALAAHGKTVSEKAIPQNMANLQWSFAPVLKEVSPAIVNISVVRSNRERPSLFANDPFFKDFFQALGEPTEKMKKSLGSAVIIDSEKAWVLTNNHVIKDAQDIRINMDDGKSYAATVLWQDTILDLAILVFNEKPENLTAIEFSNSDAIEVGDIVLAVGNPFGLGKTVTMGIISAVDRELGGSLGRFLQTDAAINPGNSGGGLITSDGKLAGLNTLIISRSGGSQGLGFAVPANLLSDIIKQIDDNGIRRIIWIGAIFDPDMQITEDGTPEAGVRVKDVWPQSHAAKAGLKAGDVIVEFNTRKIENIKDLKLQEHYTAVDAPITLGLKDGRKIAFKAEEALEVPPRNPITVLADGFFYRVTFINRSPKVSHDMNLNIGLGGIIIADIPRNSLAAQMGFRIGDVITSLNNVALNTTDDLQKINMRKGNRWFITFERGGKTHQTTIRY